MERNPNTTKEANMANGTHPRDDALVVHQAFETDPVSQRLAQNVYSGDWDENGTTVVSMPRDVGAKLLEKRGWKIESRDYSRPTRVVAYNVYLAPDGEEYCDMDEALRIALTAEVV